MNSTRLEKAMIKTDTAPYAALLLRVSLGLLFLAHAALKIFAFTVPGFVGYMGSLGLPAVLAYAVLALEVAGGLALVLGIFAPWIAIPLTIEILGTIVFAHAANGWLFMNKGGGWEFPALWAAGLIAVFLLGDGAYALLPARRHDR
jgi:putative oxidoreductase